MSDINKYPEVELELLQKRVKELEIENIKYKTILEDNDLLEDVVHVTDAEAICIREIKILRELSEKGAGLTLEDVKLLDLLHKNLLLAQGKEIPKDDKKKNKSGPKEVADLLKIVTKDK
jgi:hypothetical protein